MSSVNNNKIEAVQSNGNSNKENSQVEVLNGEHKSTTGDRYFETEDRIAWTRDGAVKIMYGKSGLEALPSITTMSLFKSTVMSYPNHRALGFKVGSDWQYLTFQEYYDTVLASAKSFIKLGLEPRRGVGILGFNAKEWFFSHFGAIFAGGLSTGIYTTNSPEAVAFVLKSSDSNVCVVENDLQLKKVLKVWEQLPSLKAVVQYSGTPQTDKPNVYSWENFIKLGKDVPDSELQQRMDDQYVNQCCSLIYTSGTTGQPKGVMLSHDNVTYAARIANNNTQMRQAKETIISYLPLSHIAAQMLDMYGPINCATTVYFAQPDALKGSLNQTMKEVKPTIFFGVPRIYEKMEEKIRVGLQSLTGLKKKLLDWSRRTAAKTAINMTKGQGPAFGMGFANKIFKNLREGLGLSNCRLLYTGAAPISMDTHDFFASLGLPLMEVYGMSECTGAVTMTIWTGDNQHWKPGSAGFKVPGYDYALLNQDEKGHGEIAMIGRNVFMGYLGEEAKTRETFDYQYSLRSGDVGFTDKDGFLFISGRIKELLITAGGENVAPVPIEDDVKSALPVVSNCMLVGDRMKFLSMLIALKTVIDLDTMMPTENFTEQTIDWCKSIGSSATKVSDVLDGKDAAVTKAVQTAINSVNAKSESNAKRITKFSLIPTDFSIPGGELGPTLKLMRPSVVKKYAELINSMYEDSGRERD